MEEDKINIPIIKWKAPLEDVEYEETEREKEIREEKEKFLEMAKELGKIREEESKKEKEIYKEMKYEREKQEEIRKLIDERNSKWYIKSYKEGLINYPYPKLEKLYLKERKEKITERYKRLKRIRLASKHYGPLNKLFIPGNKKLIIEINELIKPKKGLISIIEMINYYCESYGIYQYSPIPKTGYRYYSGEQIIIYIIDENMKNKSIKKLSKAARLKKYGIYKIDNCWKVIITLQKWKGCKDWERMKFIGNIGYYNIDPREESILAWKSCLNMNDLIDKWNHLIWCKNLNLEPWPYQWKNNIKDNIYKDKDIFYNIINNEEKNILYNRLKENLVEKIEAKNINVNEEDDESEENDKMSEIEDNI